MPLYEYECEAGHRFEKIQKFSDLPIEKCPTCGEPVHKLVSSPAFQFKGTGWYITDYAKKDQDKKETKDTKDAKETKESGESKGSSGREGKESKDTSTKETPAAKTSDTSSSTTTPPTSASKDSSKGT
jgi:putative FmdB family regulatory protein